MVFTRKEHSTHALTGQAGWLACWLAWAGKLAELASWQGWLGWQVG
jgi:hypothetical protein